MAQTPRFVLDTSVLLVYARQTDPVFSSIDGAYQLSSRQVTSLLSVVSLGELESMARRRQWGAIRLARFHELLQRIPPVQITREVVAAYADVQQCCEVQTKPARPMGQNDMWIAATALATRSTLLTLDRDFDHLHPTMIKRHLLCSKTGALLAS